MTLEPGTVIAERYRIDRLLGRGGMAQVFAAFDLELDRPLALKFLSQGVELHPDSRRRFRREVALALRITHPNVIRLFDLGVASGQHFLTMELVEGESLRRTLRRGEMPIHEAVEIARQAALGLAAAHEAGVVHRDFKPENVLISTEGRVVVADFGVATEDLIAATSASALVGTSAYMAPEQANAEVATPKADLYALGLVLFEMLAQEVPLLGAGPVATAMRREKETPPSVRLVRPDVPEAIDALILALLEREPAARPLNAAYVAEKLAPFARPLSERPPPSDETDEPEHDSSERDTSALASPLPDSTAAHARKTTTPKPKNAAMQQKSPPPRPKAVRSRLPIAIGLGAVLGVLLALGGALWRRAQVVMAPRDAPTLLVVERVATATLPPEMGFLVDGAAGAGFRALAAILPGRVALARESANSAPDAIAAPFVTVSLRFAEGKFYAAYRLPGRRPIERSAARVTAAFDDAAKAFVTETFGANGVAPSPDETAHRSSWFAPTPEAVRTVRSALVEFSRIHDDQAIRIADSVKVAGFLRPLIVRAAVLGAIGPMSAELRNEIDDAMRSSGPPIDRELLKGMLAIAETEALPIVAMRDVDDPIERYNRAWTLAYGGRFDEAYGEAERLGRDPVYAGLGWRLAYDFARYYDDERESEMARQLAENLPEEPWPWIELGKARVRREELDGAKLAFARARLVGASEAELLDGEAHLAIASFDLDRAARLGRQLLASALPADRLAGHETLYAVEVLRGQFAAATERMPALEDAFKQALRVDSPDEALELGQDAFARSEDKLAIRFLEVAHRLAQVLKDYEYSVSAETKLLAIRRARDTITEAEFRAQLAAQEKQLRDRGISPNAREYASFSTLIAAYAHKKCEALRGDAVVKLSNRPIVIVAMAECELQQKAPERALARLSGMFIGHGRRTYPTLVVQRELLLGDALVQLGRTDEAKPHLERVVSLWSHAPDKGEVGRAQKLLAGK